MVSLRRLRLGTIGGPVAKIGQGRPQPFLVAGSSEGCDGNDTALFSAQSMCRVHRSFPRVVLRVGDFLQPLDGFAVDGSSEGEGRRARAESLIKEEILTAAEADGEMAYRLATYFALDGEATEALHWLRRAIYLGDENYP